MQIRYDSKGRETITFTVNESRKLQSTLRLLTSLARARGNDALMDAIKLIQAEVPLADPEKELAGEDERPGEEATPN